MKHIFIVNKISGKKRGLKTVSIIEDIMQKHHYDYEIHITQYPTHAKKIAANYKKEADVTIYAVGGDGTILEVVNGIEEGIPLGIIPCGSGNDFYRLLGSDNSDLEKIIEDTIDAKTVWIDYGISDRMKFINGTSLGIDALVNYDASSMIRKTVFDKNSAYALSIIKKVIIPKASRLKIDIDGQHFEDDFLIVAIMNGRYYGNGALPAPESILNDGYFDIVMVKKYNPFLVYALLGKYLKGKHLNDKHFIHLKGQEINIEASKEVAIQSDGENYKSKHLHISLKHNKLLLKVPDYLDIIK